MSDEILTCCEWRTLARAEEAKARRASEDAARCREALGALVAALAPTLQMESEPLRLACRTIEAARRQHRSALLGEREQMRGLLKARIPEASGYWPVIDAVLDRMRELDGFAERILAASTERHLKGCADAQTPQPPRNELEAHPFYGNQYTGGQGGGGKDKDEGGSGKLPKGDTEVAGLPAQVTPNGNGLDVRVGLDGNMSGRTISLVNTWMETPNLNTTFGAFEDKGKARDVVDKLAEHAHALGKSELQLASGREGDRGFSREDKDFGLWLKDSGGRAGIRLDKDQGGFWAVKVNLKQYLASAKKGK